MNDKVNNPKHYTSHPSGIECIQITEHYNFCIGNAIKYLWRQGLKEETGYETLDKQVEDCKKAIWYINRHIESITKGMDKPLTNKEKVDLLGRLPLEKQFIKDLNAPIIAGGAEMLERKVSARALISAVQPQKSWLDCND